MKSVNIYIILVALIIGGLIVIRNTSDGSRADKVSKYDDFAQCLTDAGAKFYGAYWCPHCQSQKELFDNSSKLPYVECSTPNGQGQIKLCTDLGITGYPTWIFEDGSRLDGQRSFEELGEKTNCPVPTV